MNCDDIENVCVPYLTKPSNEINEELLPELYLCIDTFKNTLTILKKYFIKSVNIKKQNYMFIVLPSDDCLIKMTNEINKRNLDPVREWFNYFQYNASNNNVIIKKIEHGEQMYLSNYICILEKQLKSEIYNEYIGLKLKIRSVLLDTHLKTGLELEILNYVKKNFNDVIFKKMELNDIIIDKVVCTYYYDHNSDEYNNYLYASFQLPFYNYLHGKGRFIYYLTIDSNLNMINECVLCSKFGQINY